MPVLATPIVALPDAKDFLNISDTASDDKLTQFIAVASQMIVNRVGQVAGSQTVDEWHDGGTERIVLRNQAAIQSVTSLTESYGSIVYTLTQVSLDGSNSLPFAFTVDLDTGVLVRRAAGIAVPFAAGVRNIHVTYVSGYAAVPPDLSQACLLLVKHLWETQRGPSSRPGTGGQSETLGSTYSFPRRVEEILAPYSVPGIA